LIQKVFEKADGSYRWLDVVLPSSEELQHIAEEYSLHATTIQDCLDPEHLPKYEKIDDDTFIICRAFDEQSSKEADTVQALTRKVAIIIGKNFLITIHRVDQPFLQSIRDRWQAMPQTGSKHGFHLVHELFLAILGSYEMPLQKELRALDAIERDILHKPEKRHLQKLFHLKRKAGVIKEMLFLSKDIMRMLSFETRQYTPFLQDLRDNADRLLFLSQQLFDNANNLVNLHISLSAQRTNDVMRILTLFSVFFMPLTFIVGIYGMNFEHMPELNWQFGYFFTLLFLAIVALGIYIWFRRRGWLR
jgi:magnesium transporter